MNGETHFAMVARAASISAEQQSKSKPQRHPDMARLKSQPLVKALGINARMMRQQFDQLAAPAPRLRDRPCDHFLSDAPAAAMRGNPNVLDQAARGALLAQARQNAELKAANDGPVTILCDHKLDTRIMVEHLKRPKIA